MKNVIIFYKGVFDEKVLNQISAYIRSGFSGYPKAEKRLFAVFIELAQNISYYSAQKPVLGTQIGDYGIGEITITETETYFELRCKNLAPEEAASKLTERCEKIRKMDRSELRQYKKQLRSEPRREGQRGGNIGLVQIALKSDYPIATHFIPAEDAQSWYQMTVKIKKI